MAKIHITTNDGVLFETLNTSDYELSTQGGRQYMLEEILGWIDVIKKAGHEDGKDFEKQIRINNTVSPNT